MKFRFDHFNFNVFDLEKSIAFYSEAFGLVKLSEIEAEDHSFKIVFLGDEKTGFRLELTWLRDRTEPYNLGDLEYHLAIRTDAFDDAFKKHQEMGAVCFENPSMGVYFVNDPDGYWIEVLPL
ncbi:MAG: VOC family protein [Oscillospiraceae bacterium]